MPVFKIVIGMRGEREFNIQGDTLEQCVDEAGNYMRNLINNQSEEFREVLVTELVRTEQIQ